MSIVEFLVFGWSLITAILKLANLVDWSWWTVFGPSVGLIALIAGLLFIGRLCKNDFEEN